MPSIQPHLRVGEGHGATYALLPGDPNRVEKVKKWLDNPVDLAFNREYKTISGKYKGVKVLVTSTGIGSPSMAIAIEELKNIGVTTMIRIGSCGALQNELKIGDLVLASGAVRSEGTSDAYVDPSYPAVPQTDLLVSLIAAAKRMTYRYHTGIIRSHDSFYTDFEDEKERYWASKRVLASDMETSSLFVIGGLKGLNVASTLNVVVEANGDTQEGIGQYVGGEEESMKGEEREILTALEAIIDFDKKRERKMNNER